MPVKSPRVKLNPSASTSSAAVGEVKEVPEVQEMVDGAASTYPSGSVRMLGSLVYVRAADCARHRERRAEEAQDGCTGRTSYDFDAQAKQKIRDFVSPSNMGRDTCACCNELNPPSKMHAQPSSGEWLACL